MLNGTLNANLLIYRIAFNEFLYEFLHFFAEVPNSRSMINTLDL